MPKGALQPKKKCCQDKPRCRRCPLRMLAEGTLPAGYTVRHRRLVRLDGAPGGTEPGKRKSGKKPGRKKRAAAAA